MAQKTIFSPEPHKGWLPWGLLSPFLCIAFVIASVLATAPFMEQSGFQTPHGDPIGLTGLYWFLLYPFAVNGLMIVAWVLLVERRPLATIGLAGPAPMKQLLQGVLIGTATILLVVAAIALAGGYTVVGAGPALSSPDALAGIGILLLCFIVQAGVEEIMFRGWLLSVVTRKFGLPAAVVVTSLLFTFLHWSPNQHWLIMMSSFLFSAFACAWAVRAGNIWGVMGWHAGWNWLLGIGFDLPVTGLTIDLPALLVRLVPQGPDSLTGGAQGPEGSYLCSLFFLIGTAIILLRSRRGSEATT